MHKTNPFKYKVVEWAREFPYGTPNRVVASAATLKGCLSEYTRYVARLAAAKLEHKPVAVKFYCDGVEFSVESI